MANIREVAKLAGVSVATISRVLNRKGYVGKETERKIMQAMETLQYEPSALARGLAGKRMEVVALVVPDISNPFFSQLARTIEDACLSRGYTLVLCNSDNDSGKADGYIASLNRSHVAGFIFATDSLSEDSLARLKRLNIPIVAMDRSGLADSCCIIRVDNRKGARLAAEHLLEQGCRKIGHLYGPQRLAVARERLLGYEEAVRHEAWYTPSLLVEGEYDTGSGMRAAELLLERHPDLDGLLAGNDLMAIGALKALMRRKIDVPRQIALCGFDGISLTTMMEPELTTVAQPIVHMGELAASSLMNMMESGARDHQVHELETQLVIRESTKRMERE